ncbi:MBL fold metallo-hydrolase [Dermatobacter hominis]|uniref:MBL fold metallo-hydrolase n=1 Tax=Dermatobacter hominis TaxID=2884263 RepID=UPI001D0FC74C|nr:MBL fold metallo-hydrolase [Dermatobacter hominis]UDY34506.1 MBL fold metallo-hydrolase [Dermatobacter hominis]
MHTDIHTIPTADAAPTVDHGPTVDPGPRHLPVQIAPDTFVIQDTQGEGTAPMAVHLNSMVIRGAEPVVVDTGVPTNRDRYLEDLFGLVEPIDVRWVFLSHDDVDHYGNVEAVMAACRNARLVTNWFAMERLMGSLDVPPHRWAWVDDGQGFDVGDRTLHAIRPPLYDSPTTRGLHDPTTGVYWAADCFAAPVPAGAADVEELDREMWHAGFGQMQAWNSPWAADLDRDRYRANVDALASLDLSVIASCHGPAIRRGRVAEAFELLRGIPDLPATAQPGQADLDAMLRQLGVLEPAA